MAKKNEAAASLGKLGGQARAKKLTAKERKDSARRAAQARWAVAETVPGSRVEYAPGG